MELEIIEKRENPLLNRTEIKFRVKHQGEKTPERELVKNDLAEMLKVNKSLIIIDYIRPGFGMAISSGYAKVYKSMEDAKRVEPSYILRRNKFGEVKEEKAGEVKEETREKKESEEKVTEEKEENKEEKGLQKEGEKTEVTEEKTEEMKKEEVKEEEKGGNP